VTLHRFHPPLPRGILAAAMSEENAEAFKRGVEAFERRDTEAVLE
jgi:hypothetical protein